MYTLYKKNTISQYRVPQNDILIELETFKFISCLITFLNDILCISYLVQCFL